jgi:hypothetical protein
MKKSDLTLCCKQEPELSVWRERKREREREREGIQVVGAS